ncbi:50S ribosomal protein L32 [candidate division WOR-3 bacterium]|nr:50S ribosomal protein L32 [candidate division WOR-3 bacterium]
MALPKKRTSSSKGKKRRTHWKIQKIDLIICPNCGHKMRRHRVCPECGQYRGKEMITIKKEV